MTHPIHTRRRLLGVGELYGRHTSHQYDEGQPLGLDQLLFEDDDGEDGGGEDLQLVRDLISGHVQVARGDVQQVVLKQK